MTDEIKEKLIPQMIKKLNSMPNGTEISLSELMRLACNGKMELADGEYVWILKGGLTFADDELFKLIAPFEKAVHAEGYRIYDISKGACLGLPYHIPFKYKKPEKR